MFTPASGARWSVDPAVDFYADVLESLNSAGIPFLLGGTYALSHYIGTERPTKDLDIFVRPESVPRIVEHFQSRGFEAEVTYSHWLAKIHKGQFFVDVIFSSGNGIARVDDGWFAHGVPHTIFGVPVLLSPREEMIWSKAFVQERERYDGGDVIHLLYHGVDRLDWTRLLDRFGDHWRVLFSYIVLFGFAYPADRGRIPQWVVDDLIARFLMEQPETNSTVCNGTLVSREQYLPDVTEGGFTDPRVEPLGSMTEQELKTWTDAIGK